MAEVGGIREAFAQFRAEVSKGSTYVKNAFSSRPKISISPNIKEKLNRCMGGVVGLKDLVQGVPEEVAKRLPNVSVSAICEGVRAVKQKISFKAHTISQRACGRLQKIQTLFSKSTEIEMSDLSASGKTKVDDQHERDDPIEYVFDGDGKKIQLPFLCVDSAQAQKTNTLEIASLEKRKGCLEGKLKGLTEGTSEYIAVQRMLQKCASCLEWAEKRKEKGVEYVAAADLRIAVKSVDKGGWGEKIEDVHETELMNAYVQHVEVEGETIVSMVRSGVIADESNGLTDLYELKIAAKEEKTAEEQKVIEGALHQLDKLEKKLNEPSLMNKVKATVLHKKTGITAQQKAAIDRTRELLENPKAAQEACIDRRFVLEQKMLRLVQLQLEAHPSKIDKGSFVFMQDSLLSMSKKKLDAAGVAHFELHELRDQQEAFQLFSLRPISFTEKGETPYIDGEGVAHLLRPAGVAAAIDKVIVDPLVINVSVQGHSKEAVEIQKKLNEKDFDVLKSKIVNSGEPGAIALLKKCEEKLKKESSYEIAEDLAEAARLARIPVGVNCYHGKDRTSYIAYRFNVRALVSKLKDLPGIEILAKKWGAKGLDFDTVGPRLAAKNNFSRSYHLCVAPFLLPGMKTPPLLAKRVEKLVMVGKERFLMRVRD